MDSRIRGSDEMQLIKKYLHGACRSYRLHSELFIWSYLFCQPLIGKENNISEKNRIL